MDVDAFYPGMAACLSLLLAGIAAVDRSESGGGAVAWLGVLAAGCFGALALLMACR